ncbi:MAG: FtsQ-type POTRA domain-containing protein [Xanthomonadales bacterium]|nr:FtsQ-type POTRA domain-containing protein [Xanthomonadales bacterium]NIX12543.1 FtsQ-type POTRA domain-containing protein [Xanthomonadales bacterium]
MNRPSCIVGRHRCRGFTGGILMSLLLLAVAAAGVAWVYTGLTTREQWPVRWLEVDGAFERVSAEQMRAGLAPLVAGSFFTVDLESVQAAAFRQPWVSEVSVHKQWPDTVKVNVREYQPVAHWTNGRLVSARGQAFEVPGADEIQGLPWLTGPEGELAEVIATWQAFNNILLQAGLEIERIGLDRRGAWDLVLASGTEVRLGREDAAGRLRRLVGSWPQLMNGKDLAPLVVDLRYTNGFAVRWPERPVRLAGNYGKEN